MTNSCINDKKDRMRNLSGEKYVNFVWEPNPILAASLNLCGSPGSLASMLPPPLIDPAQIVKSLVGRQIFQECYRSQADNPLPESQAQVPLYP